MSYSRCTDECSSGTELSCIQFDRAKLFVLVHLILHTFLLCSFILPSFSFYVVIPISSFLLFLCFSLTTTHKRLL